jgi:tellurite resistance protein TerC
VADEGERSVWKATRLFLVVVCLELTDFIFAIDAVCVIIAQIPSVYLAFTACVFSMIGVRSLYDVADKLTKYFWCVSYGCALILIFIGLKLMFADKFHVPPIVVCSTLLATLAGSMLLSVLIRDPEKDQRISRRRSVPLSVHPMRGSIASMTSLISQEPT